MTDHLQPLPDNLRPMEAEMRTYYRELPGLLREHGEGKYAVIRGDDLFGVWDTFRDATQLGYDKFADGKFLAQKLDRRFLAFLARYFGPHPTTIAEVA